MNITAKSNFSPHRLPVQWLDAPAVGPLLICQRNLSLNPCQRHLKFGRCGSNSLPIDGRAALPRRPKISLRAFTLLELMLVIAIIGFIAAMALPHVAGFGQANSMVTATRQVQDDVALARQRAMVNRSTVYMVFLPPMFWNDPDYVANMSSQQVTNLMMHQYSAYALISLATVGDQPGQHHPQYITDWRVLPSGVFFAPWEFTLNNPGTNIFTTNTLAGTIIPNTIFPWGGLTNGVINGGPKFPFPSLYATNSSGLPLPYIAFTPQGTLTTSGVHQYEYIALARGSIFYPTDTNGVPQFAPPNLAEAPPGNDIHNPNLIQIDSLTARPTLIQNQFQ